MKKDIRNLFFITCVMFLGFHGCKKMDYTYRQFIEDGETVYVSKADSIIVRGGNERAEVSWLLLSDPKVTRYKLYWNNRNDSLEAPLQKTEDVDTVRVLIENMEEGIYEFEIVLFDKFGNTSVTVSKVGRVYGQRYQNNLFNRMYRYVKRTNGGKDLETNWLTSEDAVVYSVIKFQNMMGQEVIHRLEKEDETLILEDFPLDATFDMRTVFLPDTLALDTFYIDFQPVEPVFVDIELDKELWENAAIPGDTYDDTYRKLSDLWDNDAGTYFRMRSANTPDLPNWFTIDLGKRYILSKILLNPWAAGTWIYGAGTPKIFEIYGSNSKSEDWADWKLIGQFESIKPSGLPVGELTAEDRAQNLAGEEYTFIPMNESFQYIRFKSIETWGGAKDLMLQELTIWGQEADD